jgi:hypothetical protein
MAPQRSHTPEYTEHVVNAPPRRLSVAFDRWNTRENKLGKGYLSFESASALLAWYSTHSPKCCYEILRETAPIAVAFDIDCTFGKERHEPVIAREGLSREPDAFLASVLERIGQAFPQLRGAAPLVCTSHKPGAKLSFHIKFPGAYLRDMAERDAFTAQIKDRLATLIPLVDNGVYSLRRQMRLPFSHKFGDSARALLPAGFAAADAPDLAAVLLHMWTTVPADAAPFYDDDLSKGLRPSEPTAEAASKGVALSKRKEPEPTEAGRWTMTGSAFLRKFGLTFSEYHQYVRAELLGGTRDAGGQVQGGDGAPVLPLPEVDLVGDQLYWVRLRTCVCPKGERHDKNNFLTRIVNGTVYIGCLSERCRTREHKVNAAAQRLIDRPQKPNALPPRIASV